VEVVEEKYEITVAGRKFLVGIERGEAHVRNVAGYVEPRLREVAHDARTAPTANIKLIEDPAQNFVVIMKDGELYKNLLSRPTAP
jgi:hypothetical protein